MLFLCLTVERDHDGYPAFEWWTLKNLLDLQSFNVSQHLGICFTAGDFVPVPCKIFHRHFFLRTADSSVRQTTLIKPLPNRRKEVAALFSGQKHKPQNKCQSLLSFHFLII